MTDKERLERIEEWHEEANINYHVKNFVEMREILEQLFLEGDTDWLIEQARRVHKLTEEIKSMKEAGVANYYAYQERLYDIDELAEEAQEAESTMRELRGEVLRLSSKTERLLEKNYTLHSDLEANKSLHSAEIEKSECYYEALEFYAKWKNYIHGADGESAIDIDGGHRANQALRGESYWREELEFETEVNNNIYENPDLFSKEGWKNE